MKCPVCQYDFSPTLPACGDLILCHCSAVCIPFCEDEKYQGRATIARLARDEDLTDEDREILLAMSDSAIYSS